MLPADEDPMPFDGNPHPLPGNLQHHEGDFVVPQYPELGWNIPPVQIQADNAHHDMEHNAPDEAWEQAIEQQDSGSDVLDNSDNSVNNLMVNMMQFESDTLQSKISTDIVWPWVLHNPQLYGPVLPPAMLIEKLLQVLVPKIVLDRISLEAMPHCHFSWLTVYPSAKECGTFQFTASRKFIFIRRTARKLCFDSSNTAGAGIQNGSCSFGNRKSLCSNVSSPCTITRKRGRAKTNTRSVVSTVRRSTRQAARADGFKLEPMQDNPQPRKKPRSARPMEDLPTTPHTPINILQQVGRVLEIPDSEITKEKLDASSDGNDHSQTSK